MTPFWPGPGWEPWDDLVTAGFRVTSDRRNIAPPVVLLEVDTEVVEGTAGTCLVITGTVKASVLPPGPDTADARKWAWTGPVPVLLPYSDNTGATSSEFEELPSIELLLPFTYQQEV